MGNLCGGSHKGTPEDNKTNDQINADIRKAKSRIDNEIKLLLLGAGESGKSTIAKQMKIIHLSGFSKDECESYKSIIAANTVGSMRVLVKAAADMGFNISAENREAASRVCDDKLFTGVLTQAYGRDIKALWEDAAIRSAFARSASFQLNDSAGYYFDAIERLVQHDYVPTPQDVLRSRTKTTGIIETEFEVEGSHFRVVDVGGQRSERKKWMYCFQDVTAVIFCVAMSEYDLNLYEDDRTNRMHESLKLFKEIANTKWFLNTSMILFMNKKDLFAEKIKKTSLTVAFPEYKGGLNYEQAAKYITDIFLAQCDNPKKPVYVHETCATDTNNIIFVFNAVKDIVLNQTLTDAGML
jgi:guanine nucleotide-binding protein G(i) subunit alpha